MSRWSSSILRSRRFRWVRPARSRPPRAASCPTRRRAAGAADLSREHHRDARAADGTEQPLSTLHVRATEYTVGAHGPGAMPGTLPANSGYTYAVEYSVDEAIALDARQVRFSRPVIALRREFPGFPGWHRRAGRLLRSRASHLGCVRQRPGHQDRGYRRWPRRAGH